MQVYFLAREVVRESLCLGEIGVEDALRSCCWRHERHQYEGHDSDEFSHKMNRLLCYLIKGCDVRQYLVAFAGMPCRSGVMCVWLLRRGFP